MQQSLQQNYMFQLGYSHIRQEIFKLFDEYRTVQKQSIYSNVIEFEHHHIPSESADE